MWLMSKKDHWLNFDIRMRLFYTTLLLLCFCLGQAQSKKKKYKKPLTLDNKWAWSASASVFAFSNIRSHNSVGFDAEWFFDGHWSLRGGLSAGPNYIKITTEPFALRLLTEPRRGHSHYSSNNNFSLKGATALLLLLLNSDALCYNISIKKGLYVSLIASPLQAIFTIPDGKLHAFSLVGGGLKYISKTGFTLNSTLEYDKSFLFKTSEQGVKLNFSVGWVFK